MKYNFKSIEPSQKESLEHVDKKFQSELEYIEILYIISTNIENYRKKYNMSQKQLAEKLDITQEMVSKLESGKSNISVKKLVEIWNKLSNKEYDFASKLLNQISIKSKENYNRIYCNNYRYYTFAVYTNNTEDISARTQKVVYNKQYKIEKIS